MVNNYKAANFTSPPSGFDRLHGQTSVTALHNGLDSLESGRCHPNTREAVLDELFQFIQDDPKTRKNWILWLSGPAGSGKTTIARTLAYLCDDKGVNQASFFFCRLDLTRNGIKPLVATLAYQIACRFPTVKSRIVAEVERRPHIFNLSVEEQFRCLITTPLNDGGWRDDSAMARPHPIVCVIDALDECETRPSLEVQSNVVRTLYNLVSRKDSPVIFMLASRPEANLRMSFNRIRHSISRIYLDSSYDPSVDIRRFVVDMFEEIRTIHPLASALPHDWPKSTAVDAVVAKSSGQFIYAATVMRYISSPLSHPATNLANISESYSEYASTMPFTELDDIFAFILGREMNWRVVLTVITCHLLSRELSSIWFSLLLELHAISIKSIQRYVIGITSLVEMDDKQQHLIIHNESLVDFLLDRRRSGRFYIDLERAAHDNLMKILSNRSRNDVHLVVDYIIALLPKVINHSQEMKSHLLEFCREAVTIHPEPFLTEFGLRQLLIAFSNSNIDQECRYILHMWSIEGEYLLSKLVSERPMGCSGHKFSVRKLVSDYSTLVDRPYKRLLRTLFPRSPTSSQDKIRDAEDLHDVKHILSSAVISEATGMLFRAVTDILGYDSVRRARVLSSLPPLFRYDSQEEIITVHGGHKLSHLLLLNCPRIYHLDIEAFAIQLVIRLLSSSDSYKGDLFGDIGALLLTIRCSTPDLTSHLKKFATLALKSQLHVHVLDFATFLDGLVHVYRNNNKSSPSTPRSHSHSNAEDHPEYMELLTYFVQFWVFSHEQLDPQLLSIPNFSGIWEQIA